MSADQQFRMSKISVIIKEVDVEADDDKPLEVPMFDQTMSLLEMIKEKKASRRPKPPPKETIYSLDRKIRP